MNERGCDVDVRRGLGDGVRIGAAGLLGGWLGGLLGNAVLGATLASGMVGFRRGAGAVEITEGPCRQEDPCRSADCRSADTTPGGVCRGLTFPPRCGIIHGYTGRVHRCRVR